MICRKCGAPIELLWGRWYHVDHHTRIGPRYDHPAEPEVTERHWKEVKS